MIPSNNHLQHLLDHVLFKKRQYVVLYTLSQQTKKIKVKLRKVIPVTCRFGRKKSIIACLILAAFSSFGSVLITSEDNTSKGRSSFKGCLRGGRKILVPRRFWKAKQLSLGLHAEISVRVVNSREGIKD